MSDRAALVVIMGALAAPLVTWLPFGPAMMNPGFGIDLWGAQLMWGLAVLLVAAIVAATDRWLACALALGGFTMLVRGWTLDPTHLMLFAFGALALLALRRMPSPWHSRLLAGLAALGVFEALYVLTQRLLQIDPLWGPLTGLPSLPAGALQPLGTLGTVDAAGAYVAVTAPLMPRWALVVAIPAVLLTRSLGAVAALTIGLAFSVRWRWRRSLVAGITLCGALLLAVTAQRKGLGTVWGRLAIQKFALADWWATDPVMGLGLGAWWHRVPALQVASGFAPTGERFGEAHSEYAQWVYETGATGLACLAGWLVAHRAMFTHPLVGGPCAALAVTCATFFSFHVVPLALLGLVLIGVATSQQPRGVTA